MIYVCIAAEDNAATVGLVLWKVRQVFEEFRREYHILVADDCSTDETQEVLEPYQRALPLTVFRSDVRAGYAASLARLLREALARTDRPRRDCVVTLPADFSVSPGVLPSLIKRMDSGADVVVLEALADSPSKGTRLVRRLAPWLLRPGVRLPGVHDVMSGAYALRLMTLKSAIKDAGERLLQSQGACANAELVARAAAAARQISVLPATTRAPRSTPRRQEHPIRLAVDLFRAGRSLRVPAPQNPIQRAT
jgi:hypothetical protein